MVIELKGSDLKGGRGNERAWGMDTDTGKENPYMIQVSYTGVGWPVSGDLKTKC